MIKNKQKTRRKSTYGKLDRLTVERIGAIMEDASIPDEIKVKAAELSYSLNEYTNACQDIFDPGMARALCQDGLIAFSTIKHGSHNHTEASEVRDELIQFAEAHEPEEYKVARRCREIYYAQVERQRADTELADGSYFFAEHFDAMLERGPDGVMLDPNAEFFVPMFVSAVRYIGRDDEEYIALKKLIEQVDAGADLSEMCEAAERLKEERDAERRAAVLAKPEPKDKTSDEWRHWKLRQVEAAFNSDDIERYTAAWAYFKDLLQGLVTDECFYHVSHARAILPQLIIARQQIDELKRASRRSRAGMKAAETRKANKAA